MLKKLIISFNLTLLILSTGIAQRKVLIEQFTNSGCPSCAIKTPSVASYVNANINDVLMLAYHTSFPYFDSMYLENSFQSNQRVAFYGLASVPTSIVDGNFFTGNLVPTISTTIPNAGAITPRYHITFNTCSMNGNTVNANLLFESNDAANNGEPLKAMVVLAEKKVLKSAYVCCAGANSETEYPWVVRRLLPDENGTTLLNTALGGTDMVNVSWNATNIKDLNELRIVAFVQNTSTKAIYQSALAMPAIVSAVNPVNANQEYMLHLFPSVTNNSITVKLRNYGEHSKIKIIDMLGNTLYVMQISSPEFNIETSTLAAGAYFLSFENDNIKQTRKFIVIN